MTQPMSGAQIRAILLPNINLLVNSPNGEERSVGCVNRHSAAALLLAEIYALRAACCQEVLRRRRSVRAVRG